MLIYFAPMEGITLYVFRAVFDHFFPGVDKYFIPFLVANQTLSFKGKEIRDIQPDNNRGLPVVPQILTNKAQEFVWGLEEIASYGYREINLNLGCSMPQVARRGRGAGFLKDPDVLDRFFDETFRLLENRQVEIVTDPAGGAATGTSAGPEGNTREKSTDGKLRLRISVKTRVGTKDYAEAERLLKIYNRYPLSELIVHPRLMTDVYKNVPDWDVFEMFLKGCKHPVCYNGDINRLEDFLALKERFPNLKRVMIGRGFLRNPCLLRQIRSYLSEGGTDTDSTSQVTCTRAEFLAYHDALFEQYLALMQDERQAVGKMKEIWWYLGVSFPDGERALKKIRKAAGRAEYLAAVRTLPGMRQDF